MPEQVQKRLCLRGVSLVARHGDRTPKQKMKIKVNFERFFQIYEENKGHTCGKLTMKKERLNLILTAIGEIVDSNQDDVVMEKLQNIQDIFEDNEVRNKKMQLKSAKYGKLKGSFQRPAYLTLVAKWGGELTEIGSRQCMETGVYYRHVFKDYLNHDHDFMCYAREEERVKQSAEWFTQGFLQDKSESVHTEKVECLMDMEETPSHELSVKKKLQSTINMGENEKCTQLRNLIKQRLQALMQRQSESITGDQLRDDKNLRQTINRWRKLYEDIRDKGDSFDISKIPDIYDSIRFDLQQEDFVFDRSLDLFRCAKALADKVTPQEYGLTVKEKLTVGRAHCGDLLKTLFEDLLKFDPSMSGNPMRTRLYFTSESQIITLMNLIMFGGLKNESNDGQWAEAMQYIRNISEMSYMTQILFLLYEDTISVDDNRYHIQLLFSPGAHTCGSASLGQETIRGCHEFLSSEQPDNGNIFSLTTPHAVYYMSSENEDDCKLNTNVRPLKMLHNNLKISDFERLLKNVNDPQLLTAGDSFTVSA